MKITLPEGFTPPKNARPNEPFEIVASIRPSEDGTFSIVAIDGVPLPEEEEDDEMDDAMPMNERTDASNIKLPFEEEDDD